MNIDNTLAYKLRQYTSSGIYPMHMPGHKRNMPKEIQDLFQDIWDIDVTETDATDDLHDAHGIISDAMAYTSQIYDTYKTFFLVNGSTVGNLSAIYANIQKGHNIIISPDSHRSIYHACMLSDINPIRCDRLKMQDAPIDGAIDIDSILKIINKNDNIDAIHITSPTYDGIISDISKIADIAHSHDMLLIVDEAHGAHLRYMHDIDNDMPGSAISLGADIVIHSLHKTLPAPTQVSLLHICSDRIDIDKIEKALDIFETSSPSYILMAAIDACVRYMSSDGIDAMKQYIDKIKKFRERAEKLSHIKIYKPDPTISYDIGRLVIYADSLTGEDISSMLRKNGIEVEKIDKRYVTLITSCCDSDSGIDKLMKSLEQIDISIV